MLLSSAAAARALGIKAETLYAYVSRGLIAPVERRGGGGSWFDPADIADFAASRGRRATDDVAIDSSITLITDDGHFYRGRPAIEMAQTAPFTAVAELLLATDAPLSWTSDDTWVEVGHRANGLAPPHASTIDRLRLATAAIAANDPLASDARPPTMRATAAKLIASIAAIHAPDGEDSIEASIWTGAGGRARNPEAVALVALIMGALADHGLAASTMAARTAAAYGADAHASIGAALGAFSGVRHGAASRVVRRLLEIAVADSPDAAVHETLAAHGHIPGLGHAIYTSGDPRASAVTDRVRSLEGSDLVVEPAAVQTYDAVVEITSSRGLPLPNIDAALALVAVAFGLRAGAGEYLFALARMAGWTAHATEAAATPPVRPRARYTGLHP